MPHNREIHEFDPFTQGYIDAALQADNEVSESDRGFSDISEEMLTRMEADCRSFQEGNAADLAALYAHGGPKGDYAPFSAGYDFLLTRNGHGVGFWDRGFDADETAGAAAERLTAACEAAKAFEVYIGDDSQIYGM